MPFTAEERGIRQMEDLLQKVLQALYEDESADVQVDRAPEAFARRIGASVSQVTRAAELAQRRGLIRGVFPLRHDQGPDVASMSNAELTISGYLYIERQHIGQ